jgi:anti-sigma factor RsiW
MNCEWARSQVTFYIYDELADDARYELEQHLERCAACAGEVNAARNFKAAMSALPQLEPTPNLVAASRMRLQEALENTHPAHGWRRLVYILDLDPMALLRRLRFPPVLAAVVFIVGFAAGIGATYRITMNSGNQASLQERASAGVAVLPSVVASIAGIRSITPEPGSNNVQIQYDTVVPQQVQGSLDDARVQQLLLFAARDNTDSGVRIDSVDLLTQKLTQNQGDEKVREALIYALQSDNNAGVRLKALDGLAPYVRQDTRVRNAMLQALMNDFNPGVRMQAIQALKPARADGSVRQVLQHLASQDQNQDVRRLSRVILASAPRSD